MIISDVKLKNVGQEGLRMLLFVETYLRSLYLSGVDAKTEATMAVAAFDELFPPLLQVPLQQ